MEKIIKKLGKKVTADHKNSVLRDALFTFFPIPSTIYKLCQ